MGGTEQNTQGWHTRVRASTNVPTAGLQHLGTGGDRSRGAWTKRRTREDTVKGKGQDLVEVRGGPEVGWREVWGGGQRQSRRGQVWTGSLEVSASPQSARSLAGADSDHSERPGDGTPGFGTWLWDLRSHCSSWKLILVTYRAK